MFCTRRSHTDCGVVFIGDGRVACSPGYSKRSTVGRLQFSPLFGKIKKKLYCALKSIFPSPVSEVGWLSFTNKESLKNSWLIIFPKTENKAVRRVQVLIIKWSGEAGRGWGCCICVVRGRWENLRQEENMMFPSLHLSLRAEETKEHTVNWGWTKTRHLDFTLRVLCQCLWVV